MHLRVDMYDWYVCVCMCVCMLEKIVLSDGAFTPTCMHASAVHVHGCTGIICAVYVCMCRYHYMYACILVHCMYVCMYIGIVVCMYASSCCGCTCTHRYHCMHVCKCILACVCNHRKCMCRYSYHCMCMYHKYYWLCMYDSPPLTRCHRVHICVCVCVCIDIYRILAF
jgi:hypothetical protein